MLSEMRVRRLVEAGEGHTERVSDDLTAWVHIDGNEVAHVHVGSRSRGRIVFEGEVPAEELQEWLHKRRFEHASELRLVIASGTTHVRECGRNELAIMLIGDGDQLIDEGLIGEADLFRWLRSH